MQLNTNMADEQGLLVLEGQISFSLLLHVQVLQGHPFWLDYFQTQTQNKKCSSVPYHIMQVLSQPYLSVVRRLTLYTICPPPCNYMTDKVSDQLVNLLEHLENEKVNYWTLNMTLNEC